MPIFDQGYQHWQGTLSSHTWRWWTITRQGLRAQLKSRWVRILVILAWLPGIALAAVLIFWGLLEQQAEIIRPLINLLRLPRELTEGARSFRIPVWTICYHYFFLIELYVSMLLVVLVGPGLISQDLRFNAIPLYFSRPLRRFDYFAGKLGVIAIFLGAVTVAPAIIAWVLGVIFSLDFSVIPDTFRVLVGAVASGLVVMLSAGTLMLALSSLSRNSRYVGAFWIGIWFISGSVGAALSGIHQDSARQRAFASERRAPPRGAKALTDEQRHELIRSRERTHLVLAEAIRDDWRPVVSYTANLARLESALLDVSGALEPFISLIGRSGQGDVVVAAIAGPQYPWIWSAGVLAGLFGLSLWILKFRVKSLDRLR